jgi:formylglycine-generating enzyme required for sulfatase activity
MNIDMNRFYSVICFISLITFFLIANSAETSERGINIVPLEERPNVEKNKKLPSEIKEGESSIDKNESADSEVLKKKSALKEERNRIEEEKRRVKEIEEKLKPARLEPFKRIHPEDMGVPPAGMILISGGKISIGVNGKWSDAGPAHIIELNPFFLDINEVTQSDYEGVIGKNPSKFSGENHPVERVSWYKARKYCRKVGKRLPTEAEWEYAARGGLKGDNIGGFWYSGNTRETHPVKQKDPNALGLYDMFGNVWEWTADWYGANYYEISSIANPRGPAKGKQKVLRGGSWKNSKNSIHPSYRSYYAPGAKSATFGFRCAK